MIYFVLLLLALLTSGSTVDGYNSRTVPSTDLMMDHLHRMLSEGTVDGEQFNMVRRALTNLDNPANGPHEAKIHEIINTILKELENAYISFSTRENATKQDLVQTRDATIKASQENTKKYEDIVEKVREELTTKTAEMDKEIAQLEKQLHDAKLAAKKEREMFEEQLAKAKQALQKAWIKERESIKSAKLLFSNNVKDLVLKGISVRKGVCGEYREMQELRIKADEVDEAFQSKNIFTPPQVAKVCTKKTCQYTEGYHFGKAFTCAKGSVKERNYDSIVITKSGQSDCCKACTVTLYSHDFTGNPQSLKYGRYNIDALRKIGVKNDDVSSLQVSSGCAATLYEHDFNGAGVTFGFGSYNNGQMTGKGFRNDALSSLVVSAVRQRTEMQFPNYCAKKCHEDGFSCSNVKIASNQMLSCTQGCDIAVNGTGLEQCLSYCQRTPSSGCHLKVKDHSYNMCGSCTRGGTVPSVASCEYGCRLVHSTQGQVF